MRLTIDHVPKTAHETILIDVAQCSLCGGNHEKLPLTQLNPSVGGQIHSFICPDKDGPAINIHIARAGTQ